jgi:hypothetical protein
MFADLDKTLRKLLREELPIKNGEIDIQFEQPSREWSAKLSKPTVNLFLYDVRENHQLRQHQWEHIRNGNGSVTQKRSPMRVNCNYILTTWANDSEDEHRLLTRSMIALFRFPTIPEDRLEGTLQNPKYEILTQLARHDKLTNPAEVWSALDNELRPSVSYIVTLSLDPWSEVTGPAVQTFTLNTGHAHNLPRFAAVNPEHTRNQIAFIGGTIREPGGNPQSGLTVALKGTGYTTETGSDGRYRLGGLIPGDYTLIVWPPLGKPKEKKIKVPHSKAGEYDLVV